MRTGLLVIGHEQVGQVLLEAASRLLGMCPLQAAALAVPFDVAPEIMISRARGLLARLDDGAGVLVVTDLYGATPCNIALALADAPQRLAVVAGVNLPMLIRVLNYPDLGLEQLVHKALSGGADGVLLCQDVTEGRAC
ncbi:MAG: PTS fructose transporter subunit IIA [Gammaproteobacteria bacterium]|nr:PTS fructose transporter subunit IIA [Gammaproteobacteria bacterium]